MKKVCFVCNHGLATSEYFRYSFEEYLTNNNIKDIKSVNEGLVVGIGNNLYDYRFLFPFNYMVDNLKDSNILVLTASKLKDKLKIFNPKGKIFILENLYQSQKNEEDIFKFLVEELDK